LHSPDVAFLVPCHACGAPVRFDVVNGHTQCPHCRSDVPYDDEVLERARRHAAAIEALEKEAAASAAEADFQRQRRKLGWGWLQPLLPLLVGMYVILGLGVGVSSQFVVDPPLAKVIGEQPAGLVGFVVAMSIWAAMIALPLTLGARRRKVALARPAATIGTLGCPGCGASVPVVYGRAMACPFCAAPLLANDAANRAEQSIAEHVAAEARTAATRARTEADRRGAGESEQTVGMVVSNQLLVIGLAIVLGLGAALAEMIFHF
jgi:hypothetical protein